MVKTKHWVPLLPVLVFVGIVLILGRSLHLENRDTLPSAMTGLPLPSLVLPSLSGGPVNTRELKGEVALLNIWATWCPTCLAEHQYLNQLTQDHDLPVYGVNYKDDPVKARAWLAELGNPYVLNLVDNGQLAVHLGVYGAPETFVLDAQGIIRYRHVGELNERVWSSRLGALVESLREEAGVR